MNANPAVVQSVIPSPYRGFAHPASTDAAPVRRLAATAATTTPVRVHPAHRDLIAPANAYRPSNQVESNLSLLTLPLTIAEQETISGLKVAITTDASVQQLAEKQACLREALHLISEKAPGAFKGMQALEVFFGSKVNCELVWAPNSPHSNAFLFLGDRLMSQGSGSGLKGKRAALAEQAPALLHAHSQSAAKATRFIVHELSYLIHAHKTTDYSAKSKPVVLWSADGIAERAEPVAHQNDEFVAEVFTGLIHGKVYTPEVMAQYAERRGPNVPL